MACAGPKQAGFFRIKSISASYRSIITEETTPSIKSMLLGGTGGMGARARLPTPHLWKKSHSIQLTESVSILQQLGQTPSSLGKIIQFN